MRLSNNWKNTFKMMNNTRYEVWCPQGHVSIVEERDWPAYENAPYHCPFCGLDVRYEEE